MRFGLSRRGAVKAAAAAAGLGVGGVSSACSDAGDGSGAASPLSNTGPPDDPFEVDGTAPLDVLIFDGGYGDRYAVEGHERMYARKYPSARVYHLSLAQINELLKPLLRAGRPPDVVNDSGANQVPPDRLYADGQLTDLTMLLDAPSYDDPGVAVRDTLRPGIVADGSFGGDRMYLLNYAFTAYGLWYSGALFDDRGWAPPSSWEEFTHLCAGARAAGISPFVFQGRYPYYLLEPFMTLAVRHGGVGIAEDVDNLAPGAWKADSVRAAAEAWYEFGRAGYVHTEAASLTHIQAQDLWCRGEAVFVPCGSWLENEQRDATPPDFGMRIMGIPPLPGSAAPGLVCAGGTEAFLVPAAAANRPGGLEYLRIMLSKEGSRQFSSRAASLTCVKDADAGLDDPGVQSTRELLDTAGPDVYTFYFDKWYRTFADEEIAPLIRDLLIDRLTPAEFCDRAQEAADRLRRDGSVGKFHRG